jgi:hypothetical protein
MNSDTRNTTEHLAKAVNFPDIMPVTANEFRTAVNCLKLKHSCGYDEIKT